MKQLARLFPYLRPHVVLLVISTVLMAAVGAMEGVSMMLVKPVFDDVLGTGTPPGVSSKYAFINDLFRIGGPDAFLKISIALLLVTAVKSVCLYFANYCTVYTGQRVVQKVRNDLFAHIMHQSSAFFGKSATGMLMSRVSNDVDRVQDVMSRALADFVRQTLTLVAFLFLIFYIDPVLSSASLAVVPLLGWLTNRLGRKMKGHSWHSQELLGQMSGIMQECFTGSRVVQAFGMEGREMGRFRKATDQLLRYNLRVARILSANPPLMEMLGACLFVPFLVYAHFQIMSGKMSMGLFAVFLASLIRMYDPVRRMSRMHLDFQQSAASLERIMEVLDTREEVCEDPGAPDLPPFQNRVELVDVTFRYESAEPGSPPVLDGVNLAVSRGEVLAVVGSSGAGKTTLVNLLPRFFDPFSGSVLIDGRDIRTVSLASLRNQIALVTQETFLFNDTVRSNIAYGSGDVPHERVVEAARAALVHDFTMKLSLGYDTVVGERGARLSGGERQRLAIARAILKDSPLLILDEATSSLDSESEALVQEALNNLIRNRTTFVIAHRLSTVRNAHRIVVLDGGRVVESGTHDQLMEMGGAYRRLHEIQYFGKPQDAPP